MSSKKIEYGNGAREAVKKEELIPEILDIAGIKAIIWNVK